MTDNKEIIKIINFNSTLREEIENSSKHIYRLETATEEYLNGISIGDNIIASDGNNIFHLLITETKSRNLQSNLFFVKGQESGKSPSPEACVIYSNLFTDRQVPHIKIGLVEAYQKFNLIPHSDLLNDNYQMTKGMRYIRSLGYDLTNLSERWDEVMNQGSYGETVIGHDEIKNEVLSAIVSGKHVLLYGPPGTGKTMIANRISQVFECNNKLFTANAEWTSDDTIGGYSFSTGGNIIPVNGYVTDTVLECNKNVADKFYYPEKKERGTWIIIDEMNRAKMDFAFGALFTALDKDYSILNLPQYNATCEEKSQIYIPNTFRIIGTINNFDKNFLFKFSYALSRRFAQIYIGVPNAEQFTGEIKTIIMRIKSEIIKEYGQIVLPSDDEMLDDEGQKIIVDFVKYLRGYENDKIRDIGTALLLDALRLYYIQKYVINLGTTNVEMADITLSSIIVPSLEGVLEYFEDIKKLITGYKLSKTLRAINEMEYINY